jgi:hypothetical protein
MQILRYVDQSYLLFICCIENGHNGVLKTLRDLQINDDDLAYAVEEYVKRKGIQLSYQYLFKDGWICGSWAFFIRIKRTRDINSIVDHKVSFLTDTQCQFLGVCQYIFEAEKRKMSQVTTDVFCLS